MQQRGLWEMVAPAQQPPADPRLGRVMAIVTSWRENTELSAARAMYEIAKELGIEPPHARKGKKRKRADDGDNL